MTDVSPGRDGSCLCRATGLRYADGGVAAVRYSGDDGGHTIPAEFAVDAMGASSMKIIQVAFSVLDLDKTCAWYQKTFGFLPSGGNVNPPSPEAAACLGLPAASSQVRWMVDQQDFFQLEFFRFTEPVPRPLRGDWSPSDIGYSCVGLHVRDFDAVASRIAGSAVGPVLGPAGSRRVCVKDPEGILLEIMEDDPRAPGAGPRRRPEVPVAVRCVRLVVADLERARRFFADTLGMRPAPAAIVHTPDHERLWGLGGARRRSIPLWSGDLLLEIVSYDHPVSRPRPDGYLISDQGILNIAIGSRSMTDYRELSGRVLDGGYRSHPEMTVGPVAVRYVESDENVSVECVSIPEKEIERNVGFEPAQNQETTMTDDPAADPVAELENAAWVLAAVVATQRDAARISLAGALAADPDRTAILAAAGLVRRDGARLIPHPALHDGPEAGSAADVRLSALRQVLGTATGETPQGWAAQPDQVLLNQGHASAAIGRALATRLAPALDGLASRLASPGSRVLDVGTGVAALAIALARELPQARVTAIDTLERALRLARAELRQAGPVAERVELRRQDAASLREPGAYDLIWLAAPFLPEESLTAALPHLAGALAPGAWLVAGTNPAPPGELAGAVARWNAARNGGNSLDSGQVAAMLRESGLREVAQFPTWPGGPVLTAGRR